MPVSYNSINGEESADLAQQVIDTCAQGQQRFACAVVNLAPQRTMQKLVFLICQNHQIVWSIVQFVAVAVVNVFVRLQWTPKDLGHYQPVLADTSPVDGVCAIAAMQGASVVGTPTVQRVKHNLGVFGMRADPHAVHVAERPQAIIPAMPLSRWFAATWNLTNWGTWNIARATNFRVTGHIRHEFERAPVTQSTVMGGAITSDAKARAVRCRAWFLGLHVFNYNVKGLHCQ